MGYSAGSTIRLLQKYLPPKIISGLPTVEELNLRFKRTSWFVGIAIPLSGIVFAWGIYSILLNLNRYLAEIEGPAAFRILPERVIWCFLPLFGAPCLAWEITLRFWSLFASRETVGLYSYWSDLRCGFQVTQSMRIMALAIVVTIALATILEVPVHTTFHENEMRIQGYASIISSRYPYADVRRLMTVSGYLDRRGTFHPDAKIVLVFADGRSWSSADHRDPGNNIDPQLLYFLEKKTGLALEQSEI
jgi:hypothetical protein